MADAHGGVFVTGTDTGVGKSVVSAGIARAMADGGRSVGVMKPAESGCGPEAVSGRAWPADAGLLARAARVDDPVAIVTPCRLRAPLAPRVAAEIEKTTVDIDAMCAAYDRLRKKYRVLVVEGCGGLAVPLTETELVSGFARRLGLPLLVVARPDLGTINHTYLTIEHARGAGLGVIGVVLNAADERHDGAAERTNPAEIERVCDVPVLARVRYIGEPDDPRACADAIRAHGGFDAVCAAMGMGNNEPQKKTRGTR